MVCRTCLQGSELYKSIFDTEGIEVNMATIIRNYLYFEVTVNDAISTYICISCWNHLKSFHKFYSNVQEAQSKLSNAIYIKQEVDSFEEESFENVNNSSDDSINKSIEENDPIKNLNEIETEKVDIDEVVNSINILSNKIEAMKKQIQIERKREEQDSEDLSLSENSLDVNNEIRNSKIIESINKENCELGLKESQEKQHFNSDDNIVENKKKDLNENIAKYMKMQCELCPTECPTFIELMKHYRGAHMRTGYITCCNKKFFELRYLWNHLNKHMESNSIRCELCDKIYPDMRLLKLHYMRMHTPEDKKIHKCDVCSKSFPKIYLLNAHKVTHMAKEEWNYHCELCGIAFPSKHRLQTHTRFQHRNGHMKHHKGKEKDLINSDAFKCNICGKSLTTKISLNTHIRYHKLKSMHQCNQCSKSFSRPRFLMEHMSTHTGEYLYGCNYCPRMFKFSTSLYSHRKKKHLKEWEEERKNKDYSERNLLKKAEEKSASQNSDEAYCAKEEDASKNICESHEES